MALPFSGGSATGLSGHRRLDQCRCRWISINEAGPGCRSGCARL